MQSREAGMWDNRFALLPYPTCKLACGYHHTYHFECSITRLIGFFFLILRSYKNEIIHKVWNFGQCLNNKNMASWRNNMKWNNFKSTWTKSYGNQVFFFFPRSNEVNVWVPEKRGGQVPLLKLKISILIVADLALCFPRKICAHFHIEGGPNFVV